MKSASQKTKNLSVKTISKGKSIKELEIKPSINTCCTWQRI